MKLHTEKCRAPFVATQILQHPQRTQSGECIFTKVKTHPLRLVEYGFVWHYYISIVVHEIQENHKNYTFYLSYWYDTIRKTQQEERTWQTKENTSSVSASCY